jgi:Ni,Fe-hydrogenase III large subunit
LARRVKNGPNKLERRKQTPVLKRLVAEIRGLYSILLWVACLYAFIGFGLDTNQLSNVRLTLNLAGSSDCYLSNNNFHEHA